MPVTKVYDGLPSSILRKTKSFVWTDFDTHEGDDLETIKDTMDALLSENIPFVIGHRGHAMVVIGAIDNGMFVEVIDSDNHGSGVGKRNLDHIKAGPHIRLAFLARE